MRKYTRVKDEFECRLAGGCPAEDWILDHNGDIDDVCADCPFMEMINELADYEDKFDDDLK